jgi:hypothetical protein
MRAESYNCSESLVKANRSIAHRIYQAFSCDIARAVSRGTLRLSPLLEGGHRWSVWTRRIASSAPVSQSDAT